MTLRRQARVWHLRTQKLHESPETETITQFSTMRAPCLLSTFTLLLSSFFLPSERQRAPISPVGALTPPQDAIHFAMEKLQEDSLEGVCLQVGKSRFDQDGIRVLCESDAFPLSRRGRQLADTELLRRHNHSSTLLPRHYLDRRFLCLDCGRLEVWTAEQQKGWHEDGHRSLNSHPVRCPACHAAPSGPSPAIGGGRCRQIAGSPLGANLPGEGCDRIRALSDTPPTSGALATIEAALQSNWWSLRVVAIQTLGHRGGPDQIRRLEAFITAGNACAQECRGRAARMSACRRQSCWAYVAADAARCALSMTV